MKSPVPAPFTTNLSHLIIHSQDRDASTSTSIQWMTLPPYLPGQAYQEQIVCQRPAGLHQSVWEGKPRTQSYSKAGRVAASQVGGQNKESRASLILETTSAMSPMIPEQSHSDKAGLKSNPEVKTGQGLEQQSRWLTMGTAAKEYN